MYVTWSHNHTYFFLFFPSSLLLHTALTLDPEGESGSPGGVVAAVVVIVVLILIIVSLIGVLVFFFKRQKSAKKDEPEGLTLGMLLSCTWSTVEVYRDVMYFRTLHLTYQIV